MTIINNAKEVLERESKSILAVKNCLDISFIKVVSLLNSCKGKIVFTGIGKSGLICRKIASTLSSTGSPAIFIDPVSAAHGDLGALSKNDLVVAISNSGETEELLQIMQQIKELCYKVIVITGNNKSSLVKYADLNLIINIQEEVCPLKLAPMSSTTATLALGDAIAVCLMKEKGFKKNSFKKLHPGGSLGKK